MRIVLAAASLVALLASPAYAESGTKLGLLNCAIEGGAGFIVGSSKDLSCEFAPASGPSEVYTGTVRKIGLDIGVTGKQLMQWLVLAPADNVYKPGALAGSYAGASAEATAVVGAGANVLVGGFDKSFTLQPVSISTQTGLNLAVGVTDFQLNASK